MSPKNYCSIGLYSKGSKLQLPTASVVKEAQDNKNMPGHKAPGQPRRQTVPGTLLTEVRRGQKW